MESAENGRDFFSRQNQRKPNGSLCPDEVAHEPELATDNLPIKEEKRAQGLVLCRSADPSDRGQVGQKTFNHLCDQVKVMDPDYRIREESGSKKVKSEEPEDAIIDEDRKAG